jgi:hypothetical protein
MGLDLWSDKFVTHSPQLIINATVQKVFMYNIAKD